MFVKMAVTDPMSITTLLAALLAGFVSFLSPCVAPLLPGYVAFIADGAATQRRVGVARATGFVAGFGILFALLGATAATLGQLVTRERPMLELAGGLVVALLGLTIASGRSIVPSGIATGLQGRTATVGSPAHVLAALPVGAAFALAWTPCIGPVLASILTVAASEARPAWGATLLLAYALGLGIPFIAGALALDRTTRISQMLRAHARGIQLVSGGVLVLLGIAIATGGFGRLTAWLARLTPSWIS